MSKKNFDDFVRSAGKKRPSPDEIEELSSLIHQQPVSAPKPVEAKAQKAEPKPKAPAALKMPKLPAIQAKKAAEKPLRLVGKEKIRITIDLEKSLYQRLKMQVVLEDTDLSTYVRELLGRDLAAKS